MGEERLAGLGLLPNHRNMDPSVSVDIFIERFVKAKSRYTCGFHCLMKVHETMLVCMYNVIAVAGYTMLSCTSSLSVHASIFWGLFVRSFES